MALSTLCQTLAGGVEVVSLSFLVPFLSPTFFPEEDQSVAVVRFAREGLRGEARPIIFPQREEEKATDLLTVPLSMITQSDLSEKIFELLVSRSQEIYAITFF